MELIELFVAGVYLQPLLWMYLYDKDIPISPKIIQVIGVLLSAVILFLRIGSGFYTPEILAFYALAVVYCIHYYRRLPNFQPVCLAMLVVFVNSYFWEFPIHMGNLLAGHVGLVMFQSAHLYPVPFLLLLGFKFPKRWWYWSCAAWTVIVSLSSIKLFLIPTLPSMWVNMVSRIIGLFTLTWILRFPEQPENRIIYTVREGLTRYDRHRA